MAYEPQLVADFDSSDRAQLVKDFYTSSAVAATAAAAGAATVAGAGYAAQMVRPASDLIAGAWLPSSGSDLYAMIDEPAPPNSDDYIYTQAASTTRIGLAAANDPSSHAGHIVRYRAKGNDSYDLTVKLLQDTTVIASWTETAASSTETTYAHELSAGEAANISDYTALRLEFEVA